MYVDGFLPSSDVEKRIFQIARRWRHHSIRCIHFRFTVVIHWWIITDRRHGDITVLITLCRDQATISPTMVISQQFPMRQFLVSFKPTCCTKSRSKTYSVQMQTKTVQHRHKHCCLKLLACSCSTVSSVKFNEISHELKLITSIPVRV